MQSLLSYPHDINPTTVPAHPPTIPPTAVPSGPAQLPITAPVAPSELLERFRRLLILYLTEI